LKLFPPPPHKFNMGCGGSTPAEAKVLDHRQKLQSIIANDRENIKTKVYSLWTGKLGAINQAVTIEQWKDFCARTHKCDEATIGAFDPAWFDNWVKAGNKGAANPAQAQMVEHDMTGELLIRSESASLWIAQVAWNVTEQSHEWKMIVKDMEKASPPVDAKAKEEKFMAEVNKQIETVVGAYAATAEDPTREPRKKGFLEKMGEKAKDVIDHAVEKTA